MHKMLLCALAATLALPAAGAEKYRSTEGKWQLDAAGTHYPDSFGVTRNDMEVTKDDGTSLKYTATVVVKGQTMTQGYDGAYDNKPRALGNGETLAYRHVSADTYASIRRDAKGIVLERSKCTVSADGQKRSCHIWLAMPGAKPITFDEAFDRAPS